MPQAVIAFIERVETEDGPGCVRVVLMFPDGPAHTAGMREAIVSRRLAFARRRMSVRFLMPLLRWSRAARSLSG
jgi:hypothetical protein